MNSSQTAKTKSSQSGAVRIPTQSEVDLNSSHSDESSSSQSVLPNLSHSNTEQNTSQSDDDDIVPQKTETEVIVSEHDILLDDLNVSLPLRSPTNLERPHKNDINSSPHTQTNQTTNGINVFPENVCVSSISINNNNLNC